jgi:hypothetical protein
MLRSPYFFLFDSVAGLLHFADVAFVFLDDFGERLEVVFLFLLGFADLVAITGVDGAIELRHC